ncbi:MAG: hypothetical protein ACJ74C_00525 [Gaiellaceae bacterium]
MRRPGIQSLAGGAAAIAAAVIGGVTLTSVSAAGPARPAAVRPFVDAAHVPPALTVRGEPVTLRYAIVCPPREDGLPCAGAGTVYLRPGTSGSFHPYSLLRGDDAASGRYSLTVPPAIAAGSFSYYAVLRDESTGATTTVPAGGAAAPQVSLPLGDALNVNLGRHAFGRARDADAAVADVSWGSGAGEVGLAGSRALGFSGPSSFDVEADGTVDVLDSVNGRVLRFENGRRRTVPLDGPKELSDFAATTDGGFEVLQPRGLFVRYRADGTPLWEQKIADRTWAKLAHGRSGSVVLQEPSEQWLPAADGGAPLARAEQARAARSAKPLDNGHDLAVARVGANELRVAELRGAAPVRSWRITSETPLGEVQLAESHGSRIVVVVRAYTDERDEFDVLVLDHHGAAARFAVASDTWTETAPLARFRLAHGALYRLRTTPSGASVDRFDLEVPQ